MRNISTALLSYYAANNGQYPENLQQLVDDEYLEAKQLKLKNSSLNYIKADSAGDGDHITLYGIPNESSEYEKILIALVDGSAKAIELTEFQKLLAKQTSKETPSDNPLNPHD